MEIQMIEKDEDIEYGKWRQRRLDALDEEIAKDKGGEPLDLKAWRETYHGNSPMAKPPQFAKHEGPQKYATKDPWPNVPWREEEVKVPTLWGALIVLLIVVGGFMVGLLWEVL